jgi:hypothetical protein
MLSPLAIREIDALQKFQSKLNIQPKIVVEESIGGEKFVHIPVSVIENTLKKYFFGLYKIECVDYRMIVNEICVHARISVYHPILREWMSYDGLASINVQQDKDSLVKDFMSTKKKNALHKNLPAAYAFAIKNAAKKIGKVFGADLNRKHEDSYVGFTFNADKEEING